MTRFYPASALIGVIFMFIVRSIKRLFRKPEPVTLPVVTSMASISITDLKGYISDDWGNTILNGQIVAQPITLKKDLARHKRQQAKARKIMKSLREQNSLRVRPPARSVAGVADVAPKPSTAVISTSSILSNACAAKAEHDGFIVAPTV
mgnify:CR=1 FL=1